MPTFTQTKDELKASVDNVRNIESTINREKALGSGYTAKIQFNVKNANVGVMLDGPEDAISRIPPLVIIAYAQVLNKVRRWMADQEPDFPTL